MTVANDGGTALRRDVSPQTESRGLVTIVSPQRYGALALRSALEDVAIEKGCLQRGRQWFPHPFPARMPYEVAARAVDRFTTPGQVVLDPMSGSGTLPYAALSANRVAVGRDIDPLAVLLGRALCEPVVPEALELYSAEVHAEASARVGRRRSARSLLRGHSDEHRKFLSYWFPDSGLVQMFALANAILEDANHKLATVGAVMLSSLVISRGSGVSLAMDLSRSRPHRVGSKRTKIPLELWEEKSRAFSKFYAAQTRRDGRRKADIALGDARELDLPDCSVDAVITSPPYLNAIDYMRMSKFALIFFGAKLEVLREIRSASIGTEVGMERGDLPAHLDRLVDRKVADKSRRPMIRRYLYDLRRSLLEALRVLKPEAPAVFVLGPSIASRKSYDSPRVVSAVAEDVGFEVAGHARRDLSLANRSLPPPNRNKRQHSIHQRMTCEYYLALRKPP